MRTPRIDLNCDVGEGAPHDAELMPLITSANIACGAHAGDATTMRETLLLAARHGVAAGAHPGYPDRSTFGRVHMEMAPAAIYDTMLAQLETLRAAAARERVPLTHVKPHGALYNDAAVDSRIARAIVRAVFDFDPGLLLYGLAGSRLITEAEQVGIRAVAEAFADRAYENDGTLRPRGEAGALIEDPGAAVAQVLRVVAERTAVAASGREIPLHAGTICIHGDGARAVEMARAVRHALDEAGVVVTAPGTA